MIIEYSNAKEFKSHTRLSVAIVVASCAFFFIPTTLIVLGYLASQPTGTLISPLPQGILSDVTPSPTQALPLVAAPSDSSTSAQKSLSSDAGSNITDKVATISAGVREVSVSDVDIKSLSQIYLSPRPGDESVFSVKSKGDGQMILEANKISDVVRYIDYHIVNP